MEDVYFKPYVGKYALTEGFKKQRLMIIGDSHYCGCCEKCGVHGMLNPLEMEECINFTCNVIDKYRKYRNGVPFENSDRNWYSTYLVCERAIMGKKGTSFEDSKYYLDHIIFCNFIQTAYLENPEENYIASDYEKSMPIIKEQILKYKPTKVIVWGNAVWASFPNENDGWNYISPNRGEYNWEGHKFQILKIHHPARYFSYDKHIALIADFLS